MATVETHEHNAPPMRAAVFSDVPSARRALVNLQDVGFGREELTVVSDSARIQRQFAQYNSKRRAGSYSVAGIAIGAVGGLAVGVMAAIAVLMLGTTDETGLGARWMAALIAPMVAVVGGFVGAMMTRGLESEATNFFDQSLQPDQILVAAEAEDGTDPRLEAAERVFAEAGAQTLELERG
jgi:hypothetical protein